VQGGILNVKLDAAKDEVSVIGQPDSTIDVRGTGFATRNFSGIQSINITGNDSSLQSVGLGGR
jgi:hypothetical protein